MSERRSSVPYLEGRRRSSVVEVKRDDGVLRHPDGAIRSMSVANADAVVLNDDAKQATANEKDMTVREAIRLYPKAVMFSVAFSTAVIMEGYDLSLYGAFYEFPEFQLKYGTESSEESPSGRIIGAAWQSGVGHAALVSSSRR